MRKALSTVVLALVAAVPAFAQSPELDKVEIKATRVNGNVYVLEGLGGNVGAWVGEDSIVLVDGQFAALGPKPDGDSVVFFTRSRVIHMGDDAVVGEFPYVDVEGGGSIKGITAAAERAVKELPADVKVIPGHGPVTDIDGLKAFVSDLKAITAVVEAATRSGKTAEQAKRDRILARWEALSQSSLDTETFIDLLYADLGRSVKGKTTVPGPKARSGKAGPGGS